MGRKSQGNIDWLVGEKLFDISKFSFQPSLSLLLYYFNFFLSSHDCLSLKSVKKKNMDMQIHPRTETI